MQNPEPGLAKLALLVASTPSTASAPTSAPEGRLCQQRHQNARHYTNIAQGLTRALGIGLSEESSGILSSEVLRMKSWLFLRKKLHKTQPGKKKTSYKGHNGKAPEAKHAPGFEKDATCKVGQN